MKKYSVVQELSLQDIQNNFKKIGRDSFSLEALEVILDNEMGIHGNDLLDLDYVALDCAYYEYNSLKDIIRDYSYKLEAEYLNYEDEDIDLDCVREELEADGVYLFELSNTYLVSY